MRIVIGSDHAGYSLKLALVHYLRTKEHTVFDVGTDNPDQPVDHPDFARLVAEKIINGEAERGIMVCGSGVGASISANKIPGIYAATCHDTYSAHQGVEHNNMNVLCLGGRIIGAALAQEIADTFLNARFMADQDRFVRRYQKILAIEKEAKH
jgi:ribose 5-phosphate isomerase B